ncbi:MAG TPA: hypothetical protein VGJ66_10750 [Pyrinomonadaceae bacterium]|jgi:hypothetical protein
MDAEVDEIFLNVKRENTQAAKDTCNLDHPGCKPLDEDPSQGYERFQQDVLWSQG